MSGASIVPCGPVVPGLDVQVGAADAGAHDADLDVAGAGFRLRAVDELEPGVCAGLEQSLHWLPNFWHARQRHAGGISLH